MSIESFDDVRPVPDVTTEPYWAGARERKLLIQKCAACGNLQHYPRAVCIRCSSDNFEWTVSCGRGSVDSFTTVYRAPSGSFSPPYIVARVRLEEGPVILTQIVDAFEPDVHCGQLVQLNWKVLLDGNYLPVFSPAESVNLR